MRRQWMAMLSMLGLAAPAVRVPAQNATSNPTPPATRTAPPKKQGILISSDKPKASNSKLNVNQQNLRQQNQGAGRQGDPLATIDTLNRGQNKGDLSRTCGNNRLTKGNAVQGATVNGGGGTKNSQALTKGNAVRGTDVANGGGAGTKNSQALTKGNAVRGTDVANGGGVGTKNSQALRSNLNVNQQNLRQQNQVGRNGATVNAQTKTVNGQTKTVNGQTTIQTQNGIPK